MRLKTVVLILLFILVAVAGIALYRQRAAQTNGSFILSGTVEATETDVPTVFGGEVQQVFVREGDEVQLDQTLVSLYSRTRLASEVINSPLAGTVLERLVEPGEFAAPGSTLLVVAPLDQLDLKIYVPENLYGRIGLRQTYPVTVDSFPGETFEGTVRFISDQAEFTPRNVQTTDSRQTTVYAVKLDLAPSGGKLKPGMPADVHLDEAVGGNLARSGEANQ
jgi:HlyD family secretion protein